MISNSILVIDIFNLFLFSITSLFLFSKLFSSFISLSTSLFSSILSFFVFNSIFKLNFFRISFLFPSDINEIEKLFTCIPFSSEYKNFSISKQIIYFLNLIISSILFKSITNPLIALLTKVSINPSMKVLLSPFFSIFFITKLMNPSIKFFLSVVIIFSISSSFISCKSTIAFNLPI